MTPTRRHGQSLMALRDRHTALALGLDHSLCPPCILRRRASCAAKLGSTWLLGTSSACLLDARLQITAALIFDVLTPETYILGVNAARCMLVLKTVTALKFTKHI